MLKYLLALIMVLVFAADSYALGRRGGCNMQSAPQPPKAAPADRTETAAVDVVRSLQIDCVAKANSLQPSINKSNDLIVNYSALKAIIAGKLVAGSNIASK